jgi:CDP-diacylglycerol--glycerol-3-phosphate 3-phosphatidyltransferase
MSRRPTVRLRELLYPSNLLTLARLMLVPFVLRDLARPEHRSRALTLLTAALLTDVVDGPVARHRGEVSDLGKVIDPITDKLLLNGTALALTRSSHFPRWVALLLVIRDMAIVLGGALIYRRRSEVKMAGAFGKATTFAFGASFLCYLLDGPRSGRPVLAVALIAMLGSFLQYGRLFWRALRTSEPQNH